MTETAPENTALFLATRQKRLTYWLASFRQGIMDKEREKQVREMLDTYSLLLSKLARQSTEKEREETMNHLLATERKLTALFDSRRYASSSLSPRQLGSTIINKPR